ncbi:MAG: peptide chain release factor N(5)-glutamine methyltransferase [Flavobacteriaceae bacterium]
MIVKQYRNYFNETLKTIYPITEIDSFFFLLLEEYLGFRRVDIVLKSDFKINQQTLNLLQSATKQLEQEVPLQYIIGKTEFYGLPFVVNKHVLIPRPETEELVAWVVSESSRFKTFNTSTKQTTETKQLKILDIGTGSGCIPVSLKKQLPFAEISAIDISNDALTVAKKNAVLNNVDIHFILQDILKTVALDQHYDIIISNPPYVRELEKKELKNNVLKNEPHVALFVENDNPLIFYDKIAELAKNYLNKNGLLFFEINQYLGTETINLVNKKGLKNIQLKKDMFGNDRIIVASK